MPNLMGSPYTCMCMTSRCAARDSARVSASIASRGVRHESERLPLFVSSEESLRRFDVASGGARRIEALDGNRAGLFASVATVERGDVGEEGSTRQARRTGSMEGYRSG